MAVHAFAESPKAKNVIEGPVERIIVDAPDGSSRSEMYVHDRNSKQRFRVQFQEGLTGPQCLESARALGVRSDREFVAEKVELMAAAADLCVATGEQRVAILLVTFPGVRAPGISATAVYDAVFAASGRSVNTFWREASFNRAWATGNVFGWYTLDNSYSCSDRMAIRDAAIRAADQDVDFRAYNRIVIVMPDAGCGWAGMATLGCAAASSAGDGDFTAGTAWVVTQYMNSSDQITQLIAHELGHTLGFNHARTRSFGSEVIGDINVTGDVGEYGDPFSNMGLWNYGLYAAPQRAIAGWIAPDVDYKVVTANGAYSISPHETAGGLKALKIQRGTSSNTWLWVEYRQPIGIFDSALGSGAFGGALIHYEDGWTGVASDLIDFTPTTSFSDPTLQAGRSWTDVYSGLTIGVQSASTTGLTLNVSYGPAPGCVTADPGITISPADQTIGAGQKAAYTVTVTNRDSSSCAAGTFSLSATGAAGSTVSWSTPSLTINPGASASATLTEAAPPDTTPGTYWLSATAFKSFKMATASATLTIGSAPVCTVVNPTVSVSPMAQSGTAGTPLVFSVVLTNNDSLSCAASSFTLAATVPTGWFGTWSASSVSLNPGQSASVNIRVTSPINAVADTYPVGVQIARPNWLQTTYVTYTVVAPTPLTVGLTVLPTGSKNTSYVLNASVLQGSAPGAGTTLLFTVTGPSGTTASKSVLSDASGRASWSYRPGVKDPKGTYTAVVKATLNGQSGVSPVVQFTVN